MRPTDAVDLTVLRPAVPQMAVCGTTAPPGPELPSHGPCTTVQALAVQGLSLQYHAPAAPPGPRRAALAHLNPVLLQGRVRLMIRGMA